MRIYAPNTPGRTPFGPGVFAEIVREVSRERFSGNVVAVANRALRPGNITVRLQVLSTRMPGASVHPGTAGRRMACWDAVDAVLSVLFERYPDASVTTSGKRYTRETYASARAEMHRIPCNCPDGPERATLSEVSQ